MSAFVLSRGSRRGVPAWSGRRAWLDDVEAAVLSMDGSRRLRRRHVTAWKVYAVAMHDAGTATSTSGGDVATAHETVARALGFSRSVVERARRWLREMGLVHIAAEGRYLTAAERRQAPGRQIRAASTRVLIHARGPRPAARRRRRDVLPRRGSGTTTRTGVKRSPSRVVDNSPRPMWAQRLAGKVAEALERRGRRVVAHRHIGQLVTGLMNLALPTDTTARELLAAVELWARPAPSTAVIEPLAWFLHQARTVVDRIWDTRMRPTGPLQHRHDYRAIHSPTVRGCLTCPATITIPTGPAP